GRGLRPHRGHTGLPHRSRCALFRRARLRGHLATTLRGGYTGFGVPPGVRPVIGRGGFLQGTVHGRLQRFRGHCGQGRVLARGLAARTRHRRGGRGGDRHRPLCACHRVGCRGRGHTCPSSAGTDRRCRPTGRGRGPGTTTGGRCGPGGRAGGVLTGSTHHRTGPPTYRRVGPVRPCCTGTKVRREATGRPCTRHGANTRAVSRHRWRHARGGWFHGP